MTHPIRCQAVQFGRLKRPSTAFNVLYPIEETRRRSWNSGNFADPLVMLPTSKSAGNLRSHSSMSKKRRSRGRWPSKNAVGMLFLGVVGVIVFGVLWRSPSVGVVEMRRGRLWGPDSELTSRRMLPRRRQSSKTLVVYVYSGTDPEYEANLMFFLREGVQVTVVPPLAMPLAV